MKGFLNFSWLVNVLTELFFLGRYVKYFDYCQSVKYQADANIVLKRNETSTSLLGFYATRREGTWRDLVHGEKFMFNRASER